MVNKVSKVTIIYTKDINLFLPLMRDIIELEERFLLAMLRWCGYGRSRPIPLKFWEVYLALLDGKPAGVSGLYQNQNTSKHIGWVGWLGVNPLYRHIGIGSKLITYVEQKAKALGMTELWVYTDDDNFGAIDFYKKMGFVVKGQAITLFPEDGYDLNNIAMSKAI